VYAFTFIDIINVFGVFILFFIVLNSPRPNKYHQVVIDYFIIFSFLEIASFYKVVF